MDQDNLIEEGFSLLSGDSENKLSKLADIIANKILSGDENNVYYFTLPIWDYEINKWQPSTVGRFWNGNHWEDEVGKGDAYQKYNNFFSKAKKDFSFIEFFTKDVAELPSLFTIDFRGNRFSLEDNTLNLEDKPTTYASDAKAFVETTMPLMEKNNPNRESILGKLYDFLCKYKDDYKDIAYIYLFPSLLFRGKEDKRLISSGGTILVCRDKIDSTKLKHIAILSNLCYRELGGKNWAKKSQGEAIKSAKAAIMSRNMSHNIGSHVMAYLKQHLSSVTNIIQDNILSNLITAKDLDDYNSIYRGANLSTNREDNELFLRLILRIINEVYIPDEVVECFINKVYCNKTVSLQEIAKEMKVNETVLTEIVNKNSNYFELNKNEEQDIRLSLKPSSENANLNDLKRTIKEHLREELIKKKTNEKTNDKESATYLVKKLTKFTNTGDDVALPFLVGMGDFLSYLQERQDFIATIATDYIPYFSPINFKDFIYDELNPDKRFERHRDRRNLQPDNILLGNIARSEGLGRTIQTTSERSGQLSDIVLNFSSKKFTMPDGKEKDLETCIEIWNSNGNVFDGEPVVNSSNVIIAGREDAYKALEAMRKLEVSLPGGVIGRQAIFSIVENIIRNTAKHGNWRNQGRIELTFDFYDKDLFEKDFVKKFMQLKEEEVPILKKLLEFQKKEKNGIKLSDSEQNEYDQIKKDYIQIREKLEPWNKDAAAIEASHHWVGRNKHNSLLEVLYLFYSKSIDADDLYFVTITDNVNISESAVNKLREALIDPYIDEDSKMKEGNKGIKEIRISAAWLRGAKNEDEYYNSGVFIEEPQTGLKAPLVYVRQHKECLQYIVCLQKPRNVAVITREPLSVAAINALKERGWRYYSPEDYIKERNKSYRFTLCEDRDLYNMIRPFSSSRVYVLDRVDYWNKIKAGISEEDCKNLERYLYESLVSDKATIWIDDDKAKGVMLSKINEDKDYAVKVEMNSTYYQVKDVDVRVIDGCHSHVDYTYRKHHDTLEQFTSFMEINPNGCQFVESITGDTSTDRLVRNEKYDFRWYYSHLNAMRKKVAIFDERLFSRIYGLEEADFTKGNSSDLEELKKRYCEQNPIFEGLINDCKTVDDLYKTIKELELTVIKESRSNVYTKDYISLTYFQKGVCFYTLIKDPIDDSSKKTTFGVYGLYFDKDDCYMPEHKKNYTCRCEKVATITWTGQTIDVEFDESSKKHIKKQFDFISIHQGLLDKLYEAFDIKYSKEKKNQLTTTLLEKFGNNSYNKLEWESGFVPGLIVHSGRSKPAESDMPQMLPFIQYASIEHAVLDCKYSLIDLLENARYEQ